MADQQNDEMKFAEYLVNLIVNQDHVALKWLQFLITIEAGLVVALSFLLRPESHQILRFAIYAIPMIGIFVAVALTLIVIRERQWQSFFVNRFNALRGCEGKVFPPGKGTDGTVSGQPWGHISMITLGLAVIIILIWIVVFCSLWRIAG